MKQDQVFDLICSLSFAPGGSGSNLSQQEREYFKKKEIPNKIAALRTELAKKNLS